MRSIRTEYEQEAQLDVWEAERLKKDCIFSRNLSVFVVVVFFFIRSEFFPLLSIQSRLFIFTFKMLLPYVMFIKALIY